MTEECGNGWTAVQTFDQYVSHHETKTTQQIQECWAAGSLDWTFSRTKLQQLVSSVPRCLQAESGMLHSSKQDHFPTLWVMLLPSNFKMTIWFSQSLRSANHCILFLLTFYTASLLFWNWVSSIHPSMDGIMFVHIEINRLQTYT